MTNLLPKSVNILPWEHGDNFESSKVKACVSLEDD